MSRKHPQNGPSFSKATTRSKSLTDAELAERQAWLKAREVYIAEEAEEWQAFRKKHESVTKLPDGRISRIWHFGKNLETSTPIPPRLSSLIQTVTTPPAHGH